MTNLENQEAQAAEQTQAPRTTGSGGYTPGPWKVGMNADCRPAIVVDVPPSYGSGFCIADCNTINSFRHGVEGSAAANARLIVRAVNAFEPLLTSCRELLAQLELLSIKHPQQAAVRQRARAAIEKAGG